MVAFKAMLNADSVKQQFENALGKHKDAFVASLIDLYGGDKALQTCKPAAVVAEALRAATLQLQYHHCQRPRPDLPPRP